MSDCPLEKDDRGFYVCPRCGFGRKYQFAQPVRHRCLKAPARGLGDTIAKLTSAIGIKPCGGCKKRQKRFNEMFPYKK